MTRAMVVLFSLAVVGLVGVAWADAVPPEHLGADKNHEEPGPAVPAPLPIQPMVVGAGDDSDLRVGHEAPDFTLDAASGGTTRLADLRGHWSVIVFTDDRTTLAPLETIAPDLAKAGVTLYGVCRDAPSTLRTFAESRQVRFPLLADLTQQISQVYGMYDDLDDEIRPGLVVLDPRGVVQMALHGQSLHAPEVRQLVLHTVTGA